MKSYKIIGRRQILIYAVCAAISVLVFAVASSGAAVVETASERKLPIYCVGREQDDKTISISFDAAWGNEDTQILIDILAEHDIKVTFFVVGSWVDKYPESVKALHDAGHEVMNHSDSHPHMSKLSKQQMRQEIESCNSKIEAITGVRPTLFRAPYGEYNNDLIEVLTDLNMYCIQWDVDSLDWKNPPSSAIRDRVCSKVGPGSIVLFHNAAVNTPEALKPIIDNLLAEGFKFVPISQNIYTQPHSIDHEGRQWLLS